MKKIVIVACVAVALSLNLVEIACAEELSVARRFGAGIQANLLNLGIGPSAEYWATENVGLMAAVGALADYTTFLIRGNYLLNNTFDVAGYPARPYLGIGFAHVKGPEYDFGFGSKVEQDGSGAEIYAGLLHSASYITENLYFRGEFVLSTLTLETSASDPYTGISVKHEADWSFFSIGWGVTYYF